MAVTDRSISHRPDAASNVPGVKALFAASLLGVLAMALALRGFVSADALAPLMASLLFAAAASIAGAARLACTAARYFWRDLAGVFTLVGVGITFLIDPDQLVRLVSLTDQTE